MIAEMPLLHENLKRLRLDAGLTQMGLAVAAGLSVSIVSQIEQGGNPDPRLSTLRALARALGTRLEELAGDPAPDDAPPDPPAPRRRKRRGG